jgi:hypothetical protein
MLHEELRKYYSEAYEIVKSLEVVSSGRQFRVEVLANLLPSPSHQERFSARYSELKGDAWVRISAPSVAEHSEEGAAHSALAALQLYLQTG